MTRPELYELAASTGKSLVAETDAIKSALTLAQSAEINKVDSSDFAVYQGYVNQVRQLYIGMAKQKLPSELAALQAAQKQPEVVSNATAQSAPTPVPAQ